MTNRIRTDEIDELVSSVRDFVTLKDQQHGKADERLVLMPDQRIGENPVPSVQTPPPLEEAVTDMADEKNNVLILDTQQNASRDGLEATIAELEAAVTAQSDNWEADDGEDFAQAAWAASAFEAPASETAPSKDEAPEQPVPAAIDEDALRALVVEMVRQELGGELGERITQNVRKLVRREINRVLTSQDIGH